jgi:hypothetical protein
VKIETSANTAQTNLTQEKYAMSKKANASKKSLVVNMIGAAEAAPMDADLAALLNVLEVPGAADASAPTIEVIEQANAPVIEAGGDIIESADVETLDLSESLAALEDSAPIIALPELLPETPAVIEIPAEVLAGGESAELDAVLASIEVQNSYAAAPTGDVDPTIEAATEQEVAAATEELPAVAAEPDEEAGAAAGAAPAKTRTPRVHYANKTDRIKARLGAKLGDYLVLELADAELDGDALKAKQDETLAVIDAMSVKVKNRASLLLDWLSGKTAQPNEILKRALTVLHADGKITTGDNGNLHKNLIAKPYSTSAARAMGRNTITVMEKCKMIVASGTKGEYVPNENSLFLGFANEMMGFAAAPEEASAA